MKKNLIAVVAFFMSTSAFAIDYVVEGKINKEDGAKMIMLDYNGNIEIDSAKVVNGRFRFEGSYDVLAFVRIQPDVNTYANCVLDTLVEVDLDSHLPLSGGEITQKFIKFMDEQKRFQDEHINYQNDLRSKGLPNSEFLRLMKERYEFVRPKILDLYYKTISENPYGIGVAAIYGLTSYYISSDEWYFIYDKMSPYLKNHEVTERNNASSG